MSARKFVALSRGQVEWLEDMARADPRVKVVNIGPNGEPIVRWSTGFEGMVQADGRHVWLDNPSEPKDAVPVAAARRAKADNPDDASRPAGGTP